METGRSTDEETGRETQTDRQEQDLEQDRGQDLEQDQAQDRGREGTALNAPVYPGESTAVGDAPGADEKPGSNAPAPGTRTETNAEPAGTEPAAEEQDGGSARLLDSDDDASFRARWSDIQSMFVDDPREAVHAADALVADVMQQLAATFADHKRNLEGQWGEDDRVDTESLRVALRQYRSFFNRLLSR
ncbi:hypothetical protein [Streptomyces sp. NPDC088707]|uniref:hypothetical protein n=1 Tax=Streptomyces sp. NPDC088707 TaxID=3365871 RepID=UPI00382F4DB4